MSIRNRLLTFLPAREPEQLDESEVVAGDDHAALRVDVGAVDVGEVRVAGPDAAQLRAEHPGPRRPLNRAEHVRVSHLLTVWGDQTTTSVVFSPSGETDRSVIISICHHLRVQRVCVRHTLTVVELFISSSLTFLRKKSSTVTHRNRSHFHRLLSLGGTRKSTVCVLPDNLTQNTKSGHNRLPQTTPNHIIPCNTIPYQNHIVPHSRSHYTRPGHATPDHTTRPHQYRTLHHISPAAS